MSFGSKYYPHRYNPDKGNADIKTALDNIAECATGQAGKTYFLFPITDPIYKGGDPGPDRIIAIVSGNATPYSDYTYCLAIGHPSKTDNSFVQCPDS